LLEDRVLVSLLFGAWTLKAHHSGFNPAPRGGLFGRALLLETPRLARGLGDGLRPLHFQEFAGVLFDLDGEHDWSPFACSFPVSMNFHHSMWGGATAQQERAGHEKKAGAGAPAFQIASSEVRTNFD
jgi:hypothetical protein